MGLTKVTTKIKSFRGRRGSYEALFLVDTGATDSLAPADELEKIGVVKEGKMAYELANGTVKEYPYGLVRIEFMGEGGRAEQGDAHASPTPGALFLESRTRSRFWA